MKRDELVKELYTGLIQDCKRVYPGDAASLERDLTRLHRNVDKLSHYFYAHEMPRIGQAFRLCLETGMLNPILGMVHMSIKGGTPWPKLFNSLWPLVFDSSYGILAEPDPQALFFFQQFFFCFKKIEGVTTDSQSKKVIDEFFAQESHIRTPSSNWNCGDFRVLRDLHLVDADHRSCDDLTTELFPSDGRALVDLRLPNRCQLIADIVFGSFSEFHPEEWQCRNGPGAVADKPRTGDKYSFGVWPSRLDGLFCYDAHATIGLDIPDYLDHEHPAKLICVPKDSRGPRLIASEPSYLQFAQQSINSYLRHEVSASSLRRSICFDDQTPSQDMALFASRTGQLATVDLKSASDLLSLWAIERMIRKNPSLLEAIYSTRSRYVTDSNGRYTTMKKVAPMGNAYIFPLQTAIYTIAAIAALTIADQDDDSSVSNWLIRKRAAEVRVFGDDIIIPARAYGYLVSLLTYLGLEVNLTKSFSEGLFRESCGMDAYLGYDITPAYVRTVPSIESPESVVSTVEACNNLRKKGLVHTANKLRMLIPSSIRKRIVEVRTGSGAFGFQASQPDHSRLRVRFNLALFRREVLCLTPSSTVRHIQREGIRNLLQYVTERPQATTAWESGTKVPRGLKLRSRWVPLSDIGY